jgi:SAM-dependent methyltransferase
MGEGHASIAFRKKGKEVTGLGTFMDDDYTLNRDYFKEKDIQIIEADFMSHDFGQKKFDAVWASHILEHINNPGEFLERIKSILNDDGFLFVCVPHYKTKIVGGHLISGWNLGQLIYFLLVNGFDVKKGNFVQYGYNTTAFVQKSKVALPELHFANGDIERLSDYFPESIDAKQGFEGDLYQVNWPHQIPQSEKWRRVKSLIGGYKGQTISTIKKIGLALK